MLNGFKRHPEVINAHHPQLGTPLCVASALGNAEMVSALVERGAGVRCTARLDLLSRAQRQQYGINELSGAIERCGKIEEQTATSLALLAFDAEISKLERVVLEIEIDRVPGTLESTLWKKRLRRFESVLDLLRRTNAWTDGDSRQREGLLGRKKGLEDEGLAKALSAFEGFQGEGDGVVDLGVLSEEK